MISEGLILAFAKQVNQLYYTSHFKTKFEGKKDQTYCEMNEAACHPEMALP